MVGIVTVPFYEFIDTDEAGFYLQIAKRSMGKAFSGVQVRETGPYGHDRKFTLIFAIGTAGLKHHDLSNRAGSLRAF